jgi:hypothetical protein
MFYALKNLRAQTTFLIEKPWDVWQDFPNPPNITSKDEIEKWRTQAKTEHAFISGLSGLDPHVRISQGSQKQEMGNPPKKMIAFIADYDAACADVHIANISAKPACDPYRPSYICDTFRPGFKRLIWLFEKPVMLGGNLASANAFIKKLASSIRADLWLPGFDDHCLKAHMYYSIGSNWRELPDGASIPHHILQAWAMEADANISFVSSSISPPPLEAIADLVSDRFPGRWSGDFVLGARGIRFWDPQADNPTAAVVMPEGMRCFTGSSGFVSWREIFGARAIDDLVGQNQATLRGSVAFANDTRKYWYEHDDNWVCADKSDFADYLVSKGLDGKKPKGAGLSEIQNFMLQIRNGQSVSQALPFVYMDTGRMEYCGEAYLNISKVKVADPAPPLHDPDADFHTAGQRSFPWMERYLSTFFAPVRQRPKWVPDSVTDKDVQLMHFLAWHHRFYKSAHLRKPLQGHALLIAGHQSSGKGFFSNGFLGKAMGGFADGSSYLMGEDQWTSDVLRTGLITVDDDQSSVDDRSHRGLTHRLKRLTANMQASYNKKFGSSGRVLWVGRPVITCNLDPESLRVIPDMTQSNADKIMLFLTQPRPENDPLPSSYELDEILARELGHYLRWLKDWKVPTWLLAGDERFWVRAYHHPTLLETASEQGAVVNVLEMLRETYDEFVDADDIDTLSRGVKARRDDTGQKMYEWSGPVRQLYKMMKRMEISHIEKLSYRQMGSMLGILSSRGFKIKKLAGQDWHIVFDQSLLHNHINHSHVYEVQDGEAKE